MVYSRKPCDPQLTKLSNLEISPDEGATKDDEVINRLEDKGGNEYDDLGIPIALRKGVISCTKHPISNYLGYSKLSP